jgi:YesN/AraC family two-component response regulator
MYNNPAYVYEAMHAGASGYVLKSSTKEELLRAIRAIRQGAGFLQAEVTKPLLRRLALDAKLDAERSTLTLREIQILELLSKARATRRSPLSCRSRTKPSKPTSSGFTTSSGLPTERKQWRSRCART